MEAFYELGLDECTSNIFILCAITRVAGVKEQSSAGPTQVTHVFSCFWGGFKGRAHLGWKLEGDWPNIPSQEHHIFSLSEHRSGVTVTPLV